MTNTEQRIENVPEKSILSCLAAISVKVEKLEKKLSEQEEQIEFLDSNIRNLEYLRIQDIAKTDQKYVSNSGFDARFDDRVINLRNDIDNLAELVKDLEKSFDTMKEYNSCEIDSFLEGK